MFFLGIPYRLISFLTAHKALLAGSSIGVYFYTGVTTGVTGKTWSVRVLLAVAAVRKVGI
jgi:hypothetical protein